MTTLTARNFKGEPFSQKLVFLNLSTSTNQNGKAFETITILAGCTAVGYWRTLRGYGSWGKAGRTAP
jgi:hypothetical protein